MNNRDFLDEDCMIPSWLKGEALECYKNDIMKLARDIGAMVILAENFGTGYFLLEVNGYKVPRVIKDKVNEFNEGSHCLAVDVVPEDLHVDGWPYFVLSEEKD